MGKITTAVFEPGSTTANVYGLWQWGYGQILRIQGLHLPSMVEIHFSLQETGGVAPMRVGVTKDGVTDVVIPDSMLENDGATSDYDIFAFIYLTDDTSGQTEYKIKLHVKSRPKPEVPGGGEDPDIFHDAVQRVKESADKAAESERQAEGWAHGREDLPERAQDNAKYYAGKTAGDAAQTAEDRKEVEKLVEDAENTLAKLSEENTDAAHNIETLGDKISTANGLNIKLEKQTQIAKEEVTSLETAVQAANETKNSLEGSIEESDTAKEHLNLKIQESKGTVKNMLETKENLEQIGNEAEKIKDTLTTAITESGTAITKVNEAIKNAGTAVEETVAATSETKKATESAQSAESKLSQSTADAEELKTALDQAVGGVAQDTTAEEILKILQKSADYMAQIAESAGKAGSLNGFGLNLLEDGSVSLTYSDSDTGELQDSAVFPKETTLAALDKALGEMNENLKSIALREGGTL